MIAMETRSLQKTTGTRTDILPPATANGAAQNGTKIQDADDTDRDTESESPRQGWRLATVFRCKSTDILKNTSVCKQPYNRTKIYQQRNGRLGCDVASCIALCHRLILEGQGTQIPALNNMCTPPPDLLRTGIVGLQDCSINPQKSDISSVAPLWHHFIRNILQVMHRAIKRLPRSSLLGNLQTRPPTQCAHLVQAQSQILGQRYWMPPRHFQAIFSGVMEAAKHIW